MRNLVVVALAAIAFSCAVSSSNAATVRDHRDPATGPVVRDHRSPATGPVVRDHRRPNGGVVVRDHRRPQGGVVVRDHRDPPGGVVVRDHRGKSASQTSQPRPKKQKACLLGVVCTSNQTVVGIVDKSIPNPLPR